MDKKPRGAPKKEVTEGRWFTMRVSEERLVRYGKAAAKAGISLSAWVKKTLDRASR
jgi:predicted HicB family RNase H-like nuclease